MTNSFIETVQSLKGIEDKKNFLREFSKSYAGVIEGKIVINTDGSTRPMRINDLLLKAYEREGAHNLKTFNQWKKEGFAVKKGAKCLILWSALIIGSNDKENENGDRESKPAGKFFKIAFVFDENSVEKPN